MTKQSFNRGARVLLAVVWVAALVWAVLTRSAGGIGETIGYLAMGTLAYMIVCLLISSSLPRR